MDKFRDKWSPFSRDHEYGQAERFDDPVPFNHWALDTVWIVKYKTHFGFSFIEVEALSPEEAIENAWAIYRDLCNE